MNSSSQNDTITHNPPTYFIRLTHTHETFRLPELEALALSHDIELHIVDYKPTSPFCIVRVKPASSSGYLTFEEYHNSARALVADSILAKSIYELYATTNTYEDLHAQIKALPLSTWTPYKHISFKFSIDAFFGKRSSGEQRRIIESFSYLPFKGKIQMRNPDEEFIVSEEWELATPDHLEAVKAGVQSKANGQQRDDCLIETRMLGERKPKRLFFGRYLGGTKRDLIDKHDLKKRPYISTTSMDAELALVTANLALAGAGKLFLDPFTGTGGFMVAAAELGAFVLGSDIDGRSFRGKGRGLEKGVGSNFSKYGLNDRFGDCLTADLTNSPLLWPGKITDKKSKRWLDGIICDPPYGVREGLKVLGRRIQDGSTPSPQSGGECEHGSSVRRAVQDGPYLVDGVPSHTLPGFIAPKRPYSFNRMLDDILDFAVQTLVDGGRLAFWMPCANETTDETFPIPRHPLLDLKHVCVQSFNKWSRRLLVYQRVVGGVADALNREVSIMTLEANAGVRADELNQFRRLYFQGFNTTNGQPASITHNHG